MATISKYTTKNGTRYRVRYRTPDRRPTDKRGFRTMRDAKAFAATVEHSKLVGDFIPHTAGRATIADIGTQWAIVAEGQLSAASWRNYEAAWRLHVKPRWGHVAVADVDRLSVETWLATMPRADGRVGRPAAPTVERAFTVLLAVLDTAVMSRRLRTNPARGAAMPIRTQKARVYLAPAQVRALADASGDHRHLVLLLAYTGLRWGEAAALTATSWSPDSGRISVTANASRVGSKIIVGPPKTHEHRTVPVPAFLHRALDDRATTGGLLFPGRDGSHIVAPDVRHGWFARAVRDAGLPRLTPHDLRHTCASLAVSAGANVKALQRMLGHSKASMTLDVYADLFDSDLDAVAAALHRAHEES